MVLMQMREDDRSQVRGCDACLSKLITETADLCANGRAVAEEPSAEPGVDDCQPRGCLDDQAVVAARQRRTIRSLRCDAIR